MNNFSPVAAEERAFYARRLEAHGILPTEQRVEIARVMLARPQHLSAEQVLARVNAAGTRVSKATVYNTLNLFVAKGLLREVIVCPERVFYDSTTEPHYHVYNVDTNELFDIPSGGLEFARLPDLPAGTVQDGVEVVLKVRTPRG
ncbi:MAG TPA: Fur family transcriptional regulator [Gammaproteobacteria bacterium]|nr:Fur family transcriptional regulator [Gammaproteobacteria bacterium]